MPYGHRPTTELFTRENFDLERRVHDLLKKHDSDRNRIIDELDVCESHVEGQMKDVVQRNYTRFMDYATKIEEGAQNLLKVREEVLSLKSMLDQVAHLPLELDEDSPTADTGGELIEEDDDPLKVIKEEIDLALFENDFERASTILTGPNALSVPPKDLWQLEEDVVQQILAALRDTPGSSKSLLKLLLRLDRPQIAYDFFFMKRSKWVRSEVRRVRFSGDMVLYAKNTSTAVFQGLGSTYVEYIQMEGSNGSSNQKSTAVRWLSTELSAFSELLASQILGVELFTDCYRALAEVFKSSRDHLEPLSLDLCPHLQLSLQDTALDLLERECARINEESLEGLAEDTFTPKTGESFFVEEVHSPPLWTRTSRDKTSALITPSTQTLLHLVSSLLASIRGVCLHNTEGSYSIKGGDRPWPVLETAVDSGLAEVVRNYLQQAFTCPTTQEMDLQSTLMLYSDIEFVVDQLLPRISEVLKRTFYRERITSIDHLIEKSASIPNKLLDTAGGEWAKIEVAELYLNNVLSSPPAAVILSETKMVVQAMSKVKRVVVETLGADVVDDVVGGYVRATLKLVCDVSWWKDLFSQAAESPVDTFSKTERRMVIVNVNTLQRAFIRYSSRKSWDKLVKAMDITDQEMDKSDTILLSDRDDTLVQAMQDLENDKEIILTT
eukprot:TRINITY_DN21456_c0_g1_i1.p1 TRINITY_DN21456_c0_g1~~TRINITY_DN21456_c0_g1_i1.p1  ORF type:complete len:667 (+),score=154.60 TRINITY_DN21456_c0_g1_i1:52-2052(+)